MSESGRFAAKVFLGCDKRKFLEPLMRFTSGDVRDHFVSSTSITDFRSVAEKRRNSGGVRRSAFARFLGYSFFDFCNNIGTWLISHTCAGMSAVEGRADEGWTLM
jgi:hypothetical protein